MLLSLPCRPDRCRGRTVTAALAAFGAALALSGAVVPAAAQPVPGTESFDPRQPPTDVRVRRGETLFDVAERTRSPLQGLIQTNGLRPPYVLRAGQVLRLPPLKVHVVQRGESLPQIADRYGVDRRSLRVFNSLDREAVLRPGQRILLPALVEDRLTGLEPQDLIDLLAAERAAGRPVAPRTGTRPGPGPAAAPGMIAQLPPEPGDRPAPAAARASGPVATLPPEPAPSGPGAAAPGPAVPRTASPVPAPARQSAAASASPLPGRVETPGPAATGAGQFGWPLVGRIVETFGDKPGFRRSDGIEIEAAEGAPFGAAAAGTVAYVGDELPGYGWLVLVDHGGDWMTAYAYASRIVVRPGQRVTRGQTLGAVGTGGRARSPRLHFQVRRGIDPVDPVRQLPRAEAA